MLRNAEEMMLLSSFTLEERNFVLGAEECIEKMMQKHLYESDKVPAKNYISVSIDELIISVFTAGKVNGQYVVGGWKNSEYLEVPEELSYKSLEEIHQTLKSDPYKTWNFTYYLKALKVFIESKGYKISEVYPFKSEKICISW